MTQRFITLDIIRGIALFGILLINIPAYIMAVEGSEIGLPSAIAGNTIDLWLALLVEKKFYAMFSFLFGVGFFIFATKAEAKGYKPLWLFTRRLFFMFLFGIVHMVLFWGSILPIYAVLGLLLLPFYRRQPRTILFVMLALLIANSVNPRDEFVIVLLFLSGLWFAKKGLLNPDVTTKRFLKRVLFITIPVAIIGSLLTSVFYGQNISLTMYVVGAFAPLITFAYLASLFLIFNHAAIAQLAMPLARVGQMAFTNYLMQNILGVGLLALFGITAVTSVQVLWLAPLIYGIELIWSSLYFKRFKIGPFEWLWRKCTYGRTFTTER